MRGKEILDHNAKEILRKILSGQSLTSLQNEYQVDQSTIADYYRNIFEVDERALAIFNDILANNKQKTSTIEIDDMELERVIRQYLQGSITLKEAGAELGISAQTFKKRMSLYLPQNKELEMCYHLKRRNNYEQIDFRRLALEMLKDKLTQKEIEEKYHLVPKTLSKKISGFHNTKDEKLYIACKLLAEETMNRRELSDEEMKYISTVIEEYEEKFGEMEK